MKLNIHFLIVFFVACMAMLGDIIIYITKVQYGISILLAFLICLVLFIILIKNKKICLTSDYSKNDIFIFLFFGIALIAECIAFPDYTYDVASYHVYLQENPFVDKVNFDFFPGRIYCDFLFALGDRMHYIFRCFLGYRLGAIFSIYVLIVVFYQIKRFLNLFLNSDKSKSLLVYMILLIHIFMDYVGSYYIDNLGLVFLLEILYIIFSDEEIIKNKFVLRFTIFISGIAIGIKTCNAFFIFVFAIYALIKNRKDLKYLRFKDIIIGLVLFILPYIIYMYDNYKQVGSILFPYYNSIFKSDYFGFFNWKDRRFRTSNNLLTVFLWPLHVLLADLDYAHTQGGYIAREWFLSLTYIFCWIYVLYTIIFRKRKDKVFEFAILSLICNIVWVFPLEGYVRYGIVNWFMFVIVFLVKIANNIKGKFNVRSILEKYDVDYKICATIAYNFFVSSIILAFILYIPMLDLDNIKNVLKDRKNEDNTITIDGVWGSISDENIRENSAYPVLVRDNKTPIYNLDKNSFISSEKSLEMFYQRIKNNNIYVIFDSDIEDLDELEKNPYFKALNELNYKIVKIERIYTATDITFINAEQVWILARIEYIGD